MIKTILVPTSGTQTDESVFATALGVARPLAAHLDFYHVRLSVCEAAVRLPHVQFCVGPAIRHAIEDLEQRDHRLSAAASKHFEDFCADNKVGVRGAPIAVDGVTAQRLEETDQAERRLLFHARHRDLVVIGRPHTSDLMPFNLIEVLLMGSGRPIVIAPDSKPAEISGTIVVAWKETPEAARALAGHEHRTAAAPMTAVAIQPRMMIGRLACVSAHHRLSSKPA
jgi:nucleotide-binding universal stress UspA family protein